jgi:hypothetical protein
MLISMYYSKDTHLSAYRVLIKNKHKIYATNGFNKNIPEGWFFLRKVSEFANCLRDIRLL